MTIMSNSGIQIRLADGGYIVQWVEPRKPQEAKTEGFLEEERQTLGGCFPGQLHTPPKYKVAVRVKLEDALKLAGEVLFRLREMGSEDGGDLGSGGAFMAG